MKKILYIHGWLSSGNSNTVSDIKNILHDCDIMSPDIPPSPINALIFLKEYVNKYKPDIIIGSSLGGFYANQLKCKHKILINPAFIISQQIKPGTFKFMSPRVNNNQEFKFTIHDKYMIDDYIKHQFDNLSDYDRKNTKIILGTQDTVVTNTKNICIKNFGKSNIIEANFGHRLNHDIIKNYIIPLIEEMN